MRTKRGARIMGHDRRRPTVRAPGAICSPKCTLTFNLAHLRHAHVAVFDSIAAETWWISECHSIRHVYAGHNQAYSSQNRAAEDAASLHRLRDLAGQFRPSTVNAAAAGPQGSAQPFARLVSRKHARKNINSQHKHLLLPRAIKLADVAVFCSSFCNPCCA